MKENRLLHVVIYKRKYTNIVNSSVFVLLETEQMNSGIDHVETANAGLAL